MNTGSFGNVAPDGFSAIQEALTRRGMGDNMGALNTQSGASPTPSPLPVDPQAPQGGSPDAGARSDVASMAPQGNPEAKMILGAMRERLKAISTIEGGVPPKTSNA